MSDHTALTGLKPMDLRAEWYSQFVLSLTGANHQWHHCSNQVNTALLSAIWERYSCDLDIFVSSAKKSCTP